MNDNKRVRLMCHSLGCNIVLSLLEMVVDDTFKEKYISGLIALGPAWAGSAQTPESWISGPVYEFVPIQLSNMRRPSSSVALDVNVVSVSLILRRDDEFLGATYDYRNETSNLQGNGA